MANVRPLPCDPFPSGSPLPSLIPEILELHREEDGGMDKRHASYNSH